MKPGDEVKIKPMAKMFGGNKGVIIKVKNDEYYVYWHDHKEVDCVRSTWYSLDDLERR